MVDARQLPAYECSQCGSIYDSWGEAEFCCQEAVIREGDIDARSFDYQDEE